MEKYLIIESRLDENLRGMKLALELAKNECKIILWLMQDALQLLQYKSSDTLEKCISSPNIDIFADEFSIAQRGCRGSRYKEIYIADISLFSEHLMEMNSKPIWH
jgi:hypothetical protein